jgi:DNA-binding HxlR family transcriptional regulator
MALLDLLGRRWALRVLWELRDETLRFRELRERCGGISPTVLNARLRELRDARLVEHRPGSGYRLSEAGARLLALAEPLDRWAAHWAQQLGARRR